MIYSKIIPYKTFELKDLQIKSGHFIYGVDEGSKDYAVEILVFCDSAGNHYLISEKVCETQAEVVIEEWAHGPVHNDTLVTVERKINPDRESDGGEMSHCENCGTRLSRGVCTNCEEEYYIYNYQDPPDSGYSQEFINKTVEQEASVRKRMEKAAEKGEE